MSKTVPCRVASSPMATALLRHLDNEGKIAADHLLDDGTTIHVTLDSEEIETLRDLGVEVAQDAPLVVRDDRNDVGTSGGGGGGGGGGGIDIATGFVTGYLDAVEVDDRMTALAAAHPTRCTLLTLPHQSSGYDGAFGAAAGPATVRALRITTNPAVRSRPGFLLIGGTHAREWMNPLIALEFAEQLLANVDPTSTEAAVVATTRIVTEGDVIIVPVLNPDGLNFSIHDDAGWRKNRRPAPSPGSCPGVDNNRNFELFWGGAGSSPSPCDSTYRGPAAMSEPENRNIGWLLDEFPNIIVGVDSHSYGQVVFRPQPTGGSFIASMPISAADHAIYTSLETTFVDAVAAVNGTTYGTGSTSNHAGTTDEHLFFGHRVFGFDTECGTSFQPPWATAVPVIAEVAAGLRALALATLDLTLTTPTPLAVVQCIDRTGSMVSFGYDGPARDNGRRFVDLMSLGDSVGVVTFADPASDPTATPAGDRSVLEFPLTLLDDPGDAAAARAAIDGIAFGGWTPIGAGLTRAAAELAGASAPRAVLLMSDGYENRDPDVASVLASWPADLRVFTIALGTSADTALLDQIATSTGGIFQASPTVLDLHLVYNQMRADMTDDGLLFNGAIHADGSGDGNTGEVDADLDGAARSVRCCSFDVDSCADRLTITVSHLGGGTLPVHVIAPSGRQVGPDDFGVRVTVGDRYTNLSIERPTPGRWEVESVGHTRHPIVVAAFVRSPVRTRVSVLPPAAPHREWRVRATARWDKQRLGPVKARIMSHDLSATPLSHETTGLRHREQHSEQHLEQHLEQQPKRHPAEWTDRLTLTAEPRLVRGHRTRWAPGGEVLATGLARVHVELDGILPGGATFRRVVMRTVRVGRR